jgi:hypothetical protein
MFSMTALNNEPSEDGFAHFSAIDSAQQFRAFRMKMWFVGRIRPGLID